MMLGFLGGTFDPLHLGHLIIAEEARALLGLEKVLFIPTGQPWLKEGTPVSPSHHRLAMARLGVADHPDFRVAAMEVTRPGPSYTVDTLQELRRQEGPQADIAFLVGMDLLEELPRWREPSQILELCTLVAFSRPGHPDVSLVELEAKVPGAQRRVRLLPGPHLDIRSTDIRRRVAKGLPIRYLVPAPIEEYIARHGLYQREEEHEQPD